DLELLREGVWQPSARRQTGDLGELPPERDVVVANDVVDHLGRGAIEPARHAILGRLISVGRHGRFLGESGPCTYTMHLRRGRVDLWVVRRATSAVRTSGRSVVSARRP